MANLARRAFDRRLEADYAEMVDVSVEEAEEILTLAPNFVGRVRALLPDLLSR